MNVPTCSIWNICRTRLVHLALKHDNDTTNTNDGDNDPTEVFGTAKVTQFENPTVRIKQEVLWLDVTVADAIGVNVGQGPEELVHVQLDEGDGDGLLLLTVLPCHLVNGLWDVLQH